MPKNHISNPYIGIIEMFESENWKSSNQNRKIEIGINEAEIRIEATQLTTRIVTALLNRPYIDNTNYIIYAQGVILLLDMLCWNFVSVNILRPKTPVTNNNRIEILVWSLLSSLHCIQSSEAKTQYPGPTQWVIL